MVASMDWTDVVGDHAAFHCAPIFAPASHYYFGVYGYNVNSVLSYMNYIHYLLFVFLFTCCKCESTNVPMLCYKLLIFSFIKIITD